MHATQTALPFGPAAAQPLPWHDAGGIGFEIGWDHAQHRLTPPVEHLQPGNPLRHGWEAGKAAFGQRTRQATPPVRKWLQLRTNAWLRGRAFDTLQVTPAYLRRIDAPVCPITLEPLTRATGGLTDASVDRVNNDAGYAAGNLAVMSVRANRAKADCSWEDAMQRARRIESGAADAAGTVDGLDAAQWARLAVLMSFATPLPHEVAATLPLLVLPPPRLRVLNAVQCLQAMLTLQFTREGYAQRIAALTGLMPDADAQHALRALMHTLLARRIGAGFALDTAALRRALQDVWRDPLVLRRWQRLALRLGAAQCERIVREAQRRGLAAQPLRWLPPALATEGWALASRGYVPAQDQASPGRHLPMPAAPPAAGPLHRAGAPRGEDCALAIT